jgi:hypothetical protein
MVATTNHRQLLPPVVPAVAMRILVKCRPMEFLRTRDIRQSAHQVGCDQKAPSLGNIAVFENRPESRDRPFYLFYARVLVHDIIILATLFAADANEVDRMAAVQPEESACGWK